MRVNISIRVTVPEMVLNSAFVRQQIMQKMQSKTAPDIKRLFAQTVQGWENKPDWSQKFTNSPARVSTEVWPSGRGAEKYTLVNAGSPRHIILPKNRGRGMLRFQTGYTASTSPRSLSSRSKFRYGDFISSGIVHHPGFEARAFDETIVEQYASTFQDDMQDAIKVATVKRG